MAARTTLNTLAVDASPLSKSLTAVYQTPDQANGMKMRTTGREVVIIKSGAVDSISVTFPSVPCSHDRLKDAGPTVTANATKAFGPFDPRLFGDGLGNLFLDFTGSSGAPVITSILIP